MVDTGDSGDLTKGVFRWLDRKKKDVNSLIGTSAYVIACSEDKSQSLYRGLLSEGLSCQTRG